MIKVQRYFRINAGENEGVYELAKIESDSVPPETDVICPCCRAPLAPIVDTIQWGFWEDRYTTYFLCKPCAKVWQYSYTVVCRVIEVNDYA